MLGWFKRKSDAEIVGVASLAVQRMFIPVEASLAGQIPRAMADDPFVIGAIVGTALIFTQVESKGRASAELRGRATLAAIQTVFAHHGFTVHDCSNAMKNAMDKDEAKAGSKVADLLISAALGRTDIDDKPEVQVARREIAAMPQLLRETLLGKSPTEQLAVFLQDKLFVRPLAGRYAAGKR